MCRGVYKTHPWLVKTLRKKLLKFQPDRMIVEMPFLMPTALAASHRMDIPIILTEHNVQYKVAERLDISGAKLLKKFETWAANAADSVITVSEADRNILEATVSTDISIAPNGVDVDQFHPNASDPELNAGDDPVLIYHGSLGNAQNSEAVSRLISSIFPNIKAALPDAKLLLVGSNPPSTQQSGVVTTGLVDSLPKYVASADIAVVPLESGSGTKLKILEYFASGTPVITTEIGAEGLPLVDGENARIVESDQSFQQAIFELSNDDAMKERLASNGRTLVEDCFSWSQTLDTYNDVL